MKTTDGSRNAYVECTPDTVNGVGTSGSGSVIGATNTPTAALLTVGQNYATENGIVESGNWTMCVQNGSVWSYSTISGKGLSRRRQHWQHHDVPEHPEERRYRERVRRTDTPDIGMPGGMPRSTAQPHAHYRGA